MPEAGVVGGEAPTRARCSSAPRRRRRGPRAARLTVSPHASRRPVTCRRRPSARRAVATSRSPRRARRRAPRPPERGGQGQDGGDRRGDQCSRAWATVRLPVYECSNTSWARKFLPADRQFRRSAMKICVTGATGFVGGHVVASSSRRGDEVRVTYRDERRLERLGGPPARAGPGRRARPRRDAARGARLRSAVPHRRRGGLEPARRGLAGERARARGSRSRPRPPRASGGWSSPRASPAIGPAAPGEVGTEDDAFRARRRSA